MSPLSMYGYEGLFAVLFLEAVGLPIPGALALLIAGAACASGKMQLHLALPLALLAMMSGDTLLFVIGSKTGWKLLAFLCRVSVNPETCILRSAESFYRRGRITLVLAKFIPGINTMAPPLAGSMKMRLSQFLGLDLCGALLYAASFGTAGFLFSDVLAMIVGGFHTFGSLVAWLTGLGVLAYIAYRAWIYKKHSVYRAVPRVEVEELVARMKTDAAGDIVVADVRSHGYYDADAQRIRGSIRIEPNRLWESLQDISKEKQVYLYCT